MPTYMGFVAAAKDYMIKCKIWEGEMIRCISTFKVSFASNFCNPLYNHCIDFTEITAYSLQVLDV